MQFSLPSPWRLQVTALMGRLIQAGGDWRIGIGMFRARHRQIAWSHTGCAFCQQLLKKHVPGADVNWMRGGRANCKRIFRMLRACSFQALGVTAVSDDSKSCRP